MCLFFNLFLLNKFHIMNNSETSSNELYTPSGNSLCWEIFKLSNKKPDKAYCKICRKWYAKPNNVIGNLLAHIKSKHSILMKNNENKELTPNEDEIVTLNLAKMIVHCNFSFNCVENKYFKNFIESLCSIGSFVYNFPHKDKIITIIDKYYEEVVEKIIEKLSPIEFISLTTDSAKISPAIPFICLTCHFIDNEWKLCSIVLAIKLFDTPHTSENIQDVLNKIIEKMVM